MFKSITDSRPETRKRACLELEKASRDFFATKKPLSTFTLVDEILPYTKNPSQSFKIGGLMGLASIILGAVPPNPSPEFLDIIHKKLLPPIIASLTDTTDSRIRFYALESLYNVTKVLRSNILLYFNEIWDSLSKLVADGEQGVKTAAELYDRLVKDVITEQPLQQFNTTLFIPLLQERIHVINPNTRTFILQWLLTLDTLPDINLNDQLPHFLDGLLLYLSDGNPDVRNMTMLVLSKFHPTPSTIPILLQHTTGPSAETSFKWLSKLADTTDISNLVPQLLPSLAGPHKPLVQSILSKISTLDPLLLSTLVDLLSHESSDVRLAALNLLTLLPSPLPQQPLLNLLSDTNDQIVSQTTKLLARQASQEMDTLLLGLTKLDTKRFSTILRQLSQTIDSKLILTQFAKLPLDASTIQRLTFIMITSQEFSSIRGNMTEIFPEIYPAWCVDAISTFTLALFSKKYHLAWNIISQIATTTLSVEMLVSLDTLVQLIESPRFTHVRMDLLSPQKHAHLVKSLYGLLSLLPQSSAFNLLNQRLNSVSVMVHLNVGEDLAQDFEQYLSKHAS